MNSFNDPLFSEDYFKPVSVEESYLISTSGLSIFENPVLPTYDELASAEKIKNFLQTEKGITFLEFKDSLVRDLSDWAKSHDINVDENTFMIFNGYFNVNTNLGTKIINLYKEGIPYMEALNKALHNESIPLYLRKNTVANLIATGIKVCEEGITDNIQTAFQELTSDVANQLMNVRRKIATAVIKEHLHTNYPFYMQEPGMEIHIIKYFLKHFNDLLCLTLTGDHYTVSAFIANDQNIKTELRKLLLKSLSSWKILNQLADDLDVDNQLHVLANHIKESNESGIEDSIERIMKSLKLYGSDDFFTRYKLLDYDANYSITSIAKFAKHAILISLQQRLITQGYFTDKHLIKLSLTTPTTTASEIDDKKTKLCIYTEGSPHEVINGHMISQAYVHDPMSKTQTPFLAYYYQEVIVGENIELEKNIHHILKQKFKSYFENLDRFFTILKVFHDFYKLNPQFKHNTSFIHLLETTLVDTLDTYVNGSDELDQTLQTFKAITYLLIPLPPEKFAEVIAELEKTLELNNATPVGLLTLHLKDFNFLRVAKFIIACHEHEVKSFKLMLPKETRDSFMACSMEILKQIALSAPFANLNLVVATIKTNCYFQRCYLDGLIFPNDFFTCLAANLINDIHAKIQASLLKYDIAECIRLSAVYFNILKTLANYLGHYFAEKLILETDTVKLKEVFQAIINPSPEYLKLLFPAEEGPMLLLNIIERANPVSFNVADLFYFTEVNLLKILHKNQEKFPTIIKNLMNNDFQPQSQFFMLIFGLIGDDAEGINYKIFLVKTIINNFKIMADTLSLNFINFIAQMPIEISRELNFKIDPYQFLHIYLNMLSDAKNSTDAKDKNKFMLFARIILQPHQINSDTELDIRSFLKKNVKNAFIELDSSDLANLLYKIITFLNAAHPEWVPELIKDFFNNYVVVSYLNGTKHILKNVKSFSKSLEAQLHNIDLHGIFVDKILNFFSDAKNSSYIHTNDNLLHVLEQTDSNHAIQWVKNNENIFATACNTEKRINKLLTVIHEHAKKSNHEIWFADLEKKLRTQYNKSHLKKNADPKVKLSSQNDTLFGKRKSDKDEDSEHEKPSKSRRLITGK